ncbi:hypothetical protein [Burkholderia sp. Bp9142]|uniref:hypothetical protein n=1 Tax=Burkholderia sp. Bp9142 TaxID=2184573 RepID=UPI000F5B3AF0|nr:hypothetical protein [Burkholderia sp. Bp9142]
MKLCIHCKYYGENVPPPLRSDGRPMIRQPGSDLHCMHMSTSEGIDLTNGEPIRSNGALAYLQRSTQPLIARWLNKCGRDGRHFEAMEETQCSPS